MIATHHASSPRFPMPQRLAVRSRSCRSCRSISRVALFAIAGAAALRTPVFAQNVSPPVILQYFESKYNTIEYRMPDVFAAGYGQVYTPPPGRADTGNQSVGYDVYDRFDLGSAGNETLYGTETGLRANIGAAHRAGLDYGVDLVWNHDGYSTSGTGGVISARADPGLNVQLGSAPPQ